MLRIQRIVVIAILFISSVALAQGDPSGISFVTIGSPNNPAYNRDDPQHLLTGRGSVPYDYRIGQYEVTTAQWVDFYNTFEARPDFVSSSVLPAPLTWGAEVDPNYGGPGTRYRLIPGDPNSGMRYTGGITWRVAAMFTNWLCNNKSSALTAIQNGAYDTSTFQEPMPGVFTDQVRHNAGATYWIPTLDEWAKASYYNPHANGGQGGWWLNANGSDTQPIYAPPPSWGYNGTSNTGWDQRLYPGLDPRLVPLGAYTGVTSPWGLFDSAGATTEWTEERFVDPFDQQTYRYLGGSSSAGGGVDWAYAYGADFPNTRYLWDGLRVASDVPTPGSLLVTCALCWGAVTCTTRRFRCASGSQV